MQTIKLAYETTLPSHLYPYLRRLFAVQKFYTNQLLKQFWNREWIERLGTSRSVWKPIDEASERPSHMPSRVWRNVCAIVGSILKSTYDRMVLIEKLLVHPELIEAPSHKTAKKLGVNRLFVENAQRQLRNYKEKHGRLPKDFFELGIPEYNGIEFPTEADDSITNGQFKKLNVDIEKRIYRLAIKLPVSWHRWQWFEVEQNLPGKVIELIRQGAVLKAPSIVKRKRKCGKGCYVLKFVLEVSVKATAEIEKVLALDLSPSVSRLAVAVVFDGSVYSKPVYFSAERLVRKALRLQKEIDRLEHKIDEAYREKNYERLRHLIGEQKRKRNKLRAIRKQILELLVSEIIFLARFSRCSLIVVENLSGIRIPNWKSKVLRYLFSSWFYGKVVERLKHKAIRCRVKVKTISPANTSKFCHVCGSRLSAKGLYFKCKTCDKIWDRDYNAAVNIAKKAFEKFVSSGQPEGLISEGVRQREPSRLTPLLHMEVEKLIKRSTLLAWLSVVKISLFAHSIRKRKLWIGKR